MDGDGDTKVQGIITGRVLSRAWVEAAWSLEVVRVEGLVGFAQGWLENLGGRREFLANHAQLHAANGVITR